MCMGASTEVGTCLGDRNACGMSPVVYIPSRDMPHILVTQVLCWPWHISCADVTQEVASRGMALVYDMSEPSQKEALVGMLVGTLLEGRKYVYIYTHCMHGLVNFMLYCMYALLVCLCV